MKRQADGVRLSDDVEKTEENGNKRIKLLNNEINKEDFQVDHAKEKSVMDVTLCENSHGHNCDDLNPSISNGVPLNKDDDVFPKDSEINSIQNVHEIKSPLSNLNKIHNSCNGSYDEAVVEASASDSCVASELCYMPSLENSVQFSEENTHSDDKKIEPPPLEHCDHDLHNNKSTHLFQSETSNTQITSDNAIEKYQDNSHYEVLEKHMSESNCEISEKEAHESNCNISENVSDDLKLEVSIKSKTKVDTDYGSPIKQASQKQDNNFESEFSFESDVKKIFDVDNLTLSHLKVAELLGHTEEVLSVAADEDFILSSSADTTTKAWNMERQNIISTFSGHSSSVTSVLLLNPNQSKKIKKKMSLTKVSRVAITGSLDCHIKLWSLLEGKELASVYTFNGITCLGYLESECLVVVGTEGGKLELWNLSLKKAVVSERAHEDKITDIKVIGNYVYSVSVDGAVKVWSYEDEDLFPVYSRKRKEISSDKSGFKPTHWETVAVYDDIMYLGDNTNSIKMLDWRAGRLSMFKNQLKKQGVCNSIVAEENILLTSCYDSFTKTSSINVWKLPELTYVCTLDGTFPKINNLAVVQKDNKLKIITGGDKLFICEFDSSKPPRSEGEFFVSEYEMLGREINENPVEIKKTGNDICTTSKSEGNHSNSNRWCNIM